MTASIPSCPYTNQVLVSLLQLEEQHFLYHIFNKCEHPLAVKKKFILFCVLQASRLSTFYNGRKKRALESLRKAQSDNVAEVDLVLNGLQRAMAVEAGHDLNRVKLEAFGGTTILPGGTVSITKGASKIIENLAQTLPATSLKLSKILLSYH